MEKGFNEEFKNLLRRGNLGAKIDDAFYLNQNKIRYLETAKLIDEMLREYKTKPEVLDVGTSGFTFLIKKLFNINVTTIDLTDKFKENCKREGIRFKKCDLTKGHIPFEDNSFDMVLLLEVIEHLKTDHNILLKEISRVLKNSGILVITTPNFACLKNVYLLLKGENLLAPIEYLLKNSSQGDVHVREYTLNELINLVSKSNFKIKRYGYASYYENLHTFRASPRYKPSLLPLFLIFITITKIIPRFRRGMQVVCINQKS